MHGPLILSKLKHITENSHLASRCRRKQIDRCFHGYRICIIAVINDNFISGLNQMTASCNSLNMADTRRDFFLRHIKLNSHCRCCHSIVDHMLTRQRDIGMHQHIPHMNIRTASQQSTILNMICPDGIIFVHTKSYRCFAVNVMNCCQLIIITIDNHCSFRIHEVKNLGFCPKNAISVNKIFQMTLPDIRHHTDIRSGHFTETMHFTKCIDSHLKNRNLIIILNPKNRQRQTDFIIIVAGCFMYFILLSKNGCNEFFCTGLTHTAGDTHHPDIQLLTIKSSSLLQSHKTVFHKDTRS